MFVERLLDVSQRGFDASEKPVVVISGVVQGFYYSTPHARSIPPPNVPAIDIRTTKLRETASGNVHKEKSRYLTP